MSIGDGFNIWMGKFLWDCFEVIMIILGIIAFLIIKAWLECRKEARRERDAKMNKDIKNENESR